jgi:hypothetical protein
VALEVIADRDSEVHRNCVSSAVVHALGRRIDQGTWTLRLLALERRTVEVVLTRQRETVFRTLFQGTRRDGVRELDRALRRALAVLF